MPQMKKIVATLLISFAGMSSFAFSVGARAESPAPTITSANAEFV